MLVNQISKPKRTLSAENQQQFHPFLCRKLANKHTLFAHKISRQTHPFWGCIAANKRPLLGLHFSKQRPLVGAALHQINTPCLGCATQKRTPRKRVEILLVHHRFNTHPPKFRPLAGFCPHHPARPAPIAPPWQRP